MKVWMTYGMLVATALHRVAADYCDTNAKSRRDCLLCKVGANQYDQVGCERAGGPCFWVDTEFTSDSPYTEANCISGGDMMMRRKLREMR